MKDQDKTKRQLIDELSDMRRQIAHFEKSEEERKQAEEALEESEEKYRNVVERASDGICIIQDGLVKYTNLQQAEMWGGAVEEIIDTPFTNYVHPDELPVLVDLYNRRMAGEQVPSVYEASLRRKDGSKAHAELNMGLISYLGKPAELVITRDITERKRAEEALRESEEKFAKAFYSSPDITAIATLKDGKLIEVNDSYSRILGYTREELVGHSTVELGIRAASEERSRLVRMLEENGHLHNEEVGVYTKSGEARTLLLSAELFNISGEPCYISVAADITERRQAEEALRESEERHRIILSTTPDGFSMDDLEGRILEVNDAYCNMTGYKREELLEMSIGDVEAVQSPEDTRKRIQEIVQRGSARFETKHKRKDGQLIDVEVSANYLDVGEGQISVFVRDISERKRIDEERRRIERLESVGTLAGGIAHDFNNLLTGIMGNISLVRGYVEPESKAAERLLEAERASLRARDLTQRLLTFARGGEPIKETTAIGRLIRDSANFALRGSKCRCVMDIPGNLWQADVDKGQVNEVISNLVINADEATPGGGIINISVRNRVFGEESSLPLSKGDYIEVSVEDSGVGIPEDDLARIFEPYFTTKEKGSGLGLATTYSIINNHKGHIAVDSVPGSRTAFRIYLPATRKSSISIGEEAEDIQVSIAGKILIMDDEEAIRILLQRALSEVGYDIVVVVDGTDAITQYVRAREEGQPFDLVILDLTVPGGMGGVEAMEKLLEIDPNVKSIVSSGYSTDPIMADYGKYGFRAVIAKPYRVRELGKMIRNILQ